jgi:hypothetical protein
MHYPSLLASDMSAVVSNRTKVSYVVTSLRKDPDYLKFCQVVSLHRLRLPPHENPRHTPSVAPMAATTTFATKGATCNINAKRKNLSLCANR